MKDFRHIDEQLDDYLAGTVSHEERSNIEDHLAHCDACRILVADASRLAGLAAAAPTDIAPDRNLWPEIAVRIDATPTIVHRLLSGPAILLAAASVVAATMFIYMLAEPEGEAWSVVRLAGAPTIDARVISEESTIRVGETLITDIHSRAAVQVGSIGTVDVLASTELNLLNTRDTDHRFRLSRGTIHATINAPPRLFFVETPSALAIDLGCEYTLSVDSLGFSALNVEFGYVELEHPRRSSVIPAGYQAVSHPEKGPTVAIYNQADTAFVQAVSDFQFGVQPDGLKRILQLATENDVVSLWLLLERAAESDIQPIYTRLVELAGEPADVNLGAMVNGNLDMKMRWQEYLDLDLELMSFTPGLGDPSKTNISNTGKR